VDRCPNLLSFPTSCVCLELRFLPSTGITRLRRYYEPLRHPKAPGLSLTGVRLVILVPRQGASRVARALLVYMLSPLPRRSGWAYSFAHFTQPCQLSPIRLSGQPAHWHFRGLLSVHSRYGLHTRAVTLFSDPLSEGFNHFVTSIVASLLLGRSDLAGWDLHPLENAAFSRRTPMFALAPGAPKWTSAPPSIVLGSISVSLALSAKCLLRFLR
jgi:hypothetical protein